MRPFCASLRVISSLQRVIASWIHGRLICHPLGRGSSSRNSRIEFLASEVSGNTIREFTRPAPPVP
jgi:hypothetical protein